MVLPPNSPEEPADDETVALPIPQAGDVRIGPYKVLRKLGAGAMGEVYLAEDARLDRRIALKVLPAQFTQEPDRVRRFVREAKAASALNHPNIITIFEIGEADGRHYIATEYIEGNTLRQHPSNSRMTIEMAIDVSIQIASALNAAHRAGIIHRDIKPENVMLRPDGLVKVVDFGVAKLTEKASAPRPSVSADPADQRTLSLDDPYATRRDPFLTTPEVTIDGTEPGMILGTLAYMSPEQLRGLKVDARSDIFSLGVMLYEFIAGRSPFGGGTQADKIAAILGQEPAPLLDYRRDAPGDLQRIVGKALQKDRDTRYQHVNELLTELRDLKREVEFREKLGRSGSHEVRDRLKPAMTFARRRWKLLAPSVVAIVALIAAGLYLGSHKVSALTDKDTVVLADFTNTAGDPVFDEALRRGLALQLEQSPFLSLISDGRIAETLSLMGRPRDTRLTNQLAGEVCQRVGSKAIIEGAISGLGNRYELRLKAVESRSGAVLAEVVERADGREQVIPALGKAATSLREKLGESLASVQKFDVPAQDVTTSSLEALQAYSQGFRAANTLQDWKGAIVFFDRAVGLDPNFAMAYVSLANNYDNLRDSARAGENARRAHELRRRVSERERLSIESTYQRVVTENLEAARQTYELWVQTYPRDSLAPRQLGVVYAYLGEHEKSLSAYQESLRIDPGSGNCYANIVGMYIVLNRLNEAEATIQEAQAHNLDIPGILASRYAISFLQQDTAGMERATALLMSKPGYESVALYIESETAAYRGQMSRARELARSVVDKYQRIGAKDTAGGILAQAALREALVGNLDLAKRQAEEARTLSDHRYVEAVVATVLGLAGDAAKATRVADDLAQRYPENTSIQFHYLPMIRMAVAIGGAGAAGAVGASTVGKNHELGGQAFMDFIIMYPVYLRGQACVATGQATQGAAEFQKILDHPGLVRNEPIGALAHLGIGRAFARAGDIARSRTAYQDFFAIWKDADSDIPILRQAKTEYAQMGVGK